MGGHGNCSFVVRGGQAGTPASACWIWSSTAWSGSGADVAVGERRVAAMAVATRLAGRSTGVWQPTIAVGRERLDAVDGGLEAGVVDERRATG